MWGRNPPYFGMKLTNSLEWPMIKDEIKRLGRMLPEFSNDFYKVTIHLDSLLKDLGNLEIEMRCRPTVLGRIKCDEKVKQINEELHLIKKIHLMSVLSR